MTNNPTTDVLYDPSIVVMLAMLSGQPWAVVYPSGAKEHAYWTVNRTPPDEPFFEEGEEGFVAVRADNGWQAVDENGVIHEP